MAAQEGEYLTGFIHDVKAGLDDFDLVFTDRRLIVARMGSSGMEVIGAVVGGSVGARIGAMLFEGRAAAERYGHGPMSFDEVARADKRNQSIPYSAVERAELNGGIPTITIPSLSVWVAGKKLRFGMMSSYWKKDRASLENAKRLLAMAFGPRASFKKV